MGSRGRSIRLRIYVLVAIPLITMLGLFGYVAYTSVTNWLNLDRAPSLINATSVPLTNFVNLLQAERRAAVVYLSQPTAANLATFDKAVTVTESGAQTLSVALNSPGTRNSVTPAETTAIDKMTVQVNNMSTLRGEVTAKKLSPIDALSEYTGVIVGQGAVFEAAANSIQDAGPALQGFGLIATVNVQEDISEQDAVLASALASGSLTSADRVVFTDAVGRQQDDTLNSAALLTPAEIGTYNAIVNQMVSKTVRGDLTTIQEAVAAGIPLRTIEQQGLNPATWQDLTGTWLKANNKAGDASAETVLAADNQPVVDAKRRVWIIAAVGALGLILTLVVSLLLSRSINRRLNTLRRSALTLAHEQLPAVVARLRRGESVDVAAEAPPLRVGSDEIGQVGQAIDAVRQTAIRSAIDEAAVRQGVNDMFRNLARRNQSLLQRQLAVLDEMERRATDPDVLEDLFKMDHLTTRMRRHAEGLIILSGAPPGRSWSAPVKLIDVMRGAVAEVEDYARVVVITQSRAALSGSAVTDLIHLLAELIENATSLSPPFTQVKVSGETVANGFAIEIEDRGLGMVPQRLHDLNDRLANPPDINPANTEQLGLFVVGQLAKRHGVRVLLRPSPYGGTSAIVLIPLSLVVEEGPAAITSGGPARGAGNGNGSGYPGSADAARGPIRIAGALRHPSEGTTGFPRRTSGSTPSAADTGSRRGGRHGTEELPLVTGVPVTKAPTGPAPSFDVFTPMNRPEQDGVPATGAQYPPPAAEDPYAQSYPDFTTQAPEASYVSPYSDNGTPPAGAYQQQDTYYQQDSGYQQDNTAYQQSAPYVSEPALGNGAGDGSLQGGGPAGSGDAEDLTGLPRRVRQANLAPQLRASAAATRASTAAAPAANAASLDVMRSTLSAMQRGWQQGRSQAQSDTEGSDGN
jgi:signal transduction histidine kinase